MFSLISKPFSNVWTKVNGFRQYSQMVKHQLELSKIELGGEASERGLILGVYAEERSPAAAVLTSTAYKYNNTITKGKLMRLLRMSGSSPEKGEARVFFGVEPQTIPFYSAIAIVGLGRECQGFNHYEVRDEEKETIRKSVASACLKLQSLKIPRIDVESFGHAESAAEGAALAVWAYQELRLQKNRIDIPVLDLFSNKGDPCDFNGWSFGLQKAGAQNLTRQLQETPGNILTPNSFAQTIVEVLCKSGINVEVKVEGWAEKQNMNAFLAVGRGSCEAPIFVELSYFGTKSNKPPICLIGQGITYDCGGIQKRPYSKLKHQRGNMTGAAVVVATCRAIAGMRLPINIRGLIPLCENVIGCNAFKPGDIVETMSGKNIEITDTDQEGILVLADALLYAQNFCPKFIIDVGTTTTSMGKALDDAACGVYTNSEILWQRIKNASMHTGDRVWRFPLWDYYKQNVKNASDGSDVQSSGLSRPGKPCNNAAFLSQFVPCGQWMHIEASGVMRTNGTDYEYLRKGMAGRPTRTLIEFLAQTVCGSDKC